MAWSFIKLAQLADAASLRKQFDDVCAKQGPIIASSGSDADKLKAYALFKQATVGDCSGERPGAFQFVARAKYDAWDAVKGMSRDDAMRDYVKRFGSASGGADGDTDVPPTPKNKHNPKGVYNTVVKTPMLPPGKYYTYEAPSYMQCLQNWTL